MKIIRGWHNIKAQHRGCVATIGNFDGVHLGHQAILRQVKQISQQLSVPSMLICFEPQPKEFFAAFKAPARLTRFREKIDLLKEYDVDLILCLQFNEQTRHMPATRFIELLAKDIAIKALFVGDNFKFGQHRSGGFTELQQAGKIHGFTVTNLYTLTFEHIRVSSTRIRECLAAGDFTQAETMLGHPYSIKGKVVYGRQLGRMLNAATANIQLHRYRAPIDGVYAVEVTGLDRLYQGVANVGVRPTLDEITSHSILEVHLFNFSQNIYGKRVEVIFRQKIRNEQKFPDLDALQAAIADDIVNAKRYFSQRII